MSASTPLWTDQDTGQEPAVSAPGSSDHSSLTDAYFQHVSEADLAEVDQQLREALVEGQLDLAARRSHGEPAVRISSHRSSGLVQVVNEDMPFLVDSVIGELTRQGHSIGLVAHPVVIAHRDAEGGRLRAVHAIPSRQGMASGDTTASLTDLGPLMAPSGQRAGVESWIGIQTTDLITDEQAQELREGILVALNDVRSAVKDWDTMRAAAITAAHTLLGDAPQNVRGVRASAELLEWMQDGHFTFTGYRQYVLQHGDNGQVLVPVEGTGLGILRSEDHRPPAPLSPAGRNQIEAPTPLVITKANSRSRVHRPVYLDYVAVKTYGENGRVTGEHRFLGLWDARAYTTPVGDIPLVRDKARAVLELSGFPQDSHSGAELQQILETYPRDEMFQIGVEELWEICRQILQLQERRRTRMFLRPDVFGRFMNVLVYLPRDRYNTSVRGRIQDMLMEALDGESIEFQVRLTESVLARLNFRIRMPRHRELGPSVDAEALEARLVNTVRSWKEGVDQQAVVAFGEDSGLEQARLWDEAFPPEYRVAYEIDDALQDITRFNALPGDGTPDVEVERPVEQNDSAEQDTAEDQDRVARMKLYSDRPRTLTEILPALQNLGLEVLDERPYEITPEDGRRFYLYDLGLRFPEGQDPEGLSDLLADAVTSVAVGATESDAFDRLVLAVGLPVRMVSMLRAYAKYLRQLGVANSFGFMAEALATNPEVTSGLVSYFEARFDPQLPEGSDDDGAAAGPGRLAEAEDRHQSVERSLDDVPTLDADRVLRAFLTVLAATERTNFYQGHGRLSFKISPQRIPFAPEPRPAHEIWVYAPDVEGSHLRFGAVARGGLRWSDRREDFRTEVLGLVKAQQVKNAVIVPTGAKGGFFAKLLPDPALDRGAWMEAGQQAYRTFIRGLLDITDNQRITDAGTAYTTRDRVVRHDGPDAYLVVAADKGTASFSDIANEISADYGHWLGDAFASGGSVGYDHKAMGITARGAWESVKSHFASLGRDTQSEDFTVVGIGDMSGDVFGNGMLRSRHIRLVAAFNHLHIFIDPDPDAEASFAERERLFGLPRSSWSDYDSSLISEGGGVFDRQAKSIPLTEQIRTLLGLPEDTDSLAPNDLVQAILTADVDLLYNGGIGTYVKSEAETHAEVGDRANNGVRVDGGQLRATVVGEGGNLGMTQRGRIEAALNGVLLNTDAIDNSAGVDCSDHEVNIKILVDQLVETGQLPAEERTGLLESMTDEVARLVLETNIEQNILLRNDAQRVAEWLPSFERHMDWLVEHAGLDRDLEFLPTQAVLDERQRHGTNLTTPELAVLAAYAKINLSAQLAESDLAEDPWFDSLLQGYFPPQLQERFAETIHQHPLRREIISTLVANDVVNTAGITFVFRAAEETSASVTQIVAAYAAVKEIFDIDGFTAQMREIPATVPGEVKARTHLDARRLLDRAVRWFINHRAEATGIGEEVETFAAEVQRLIGRLPELLQGQDAERFQTWYEQARDEGLPEELAQRQAGQFESYGLLDVVLLSRQTGHSADEVAEVYYRLYDRFAIDELLERITALSREDRWQALARAALREDLYALLVDVVAGVLDTDPVDDDGHGSPEDTTTAGGSDASVRLEAWSRQNRPRLDRARGFIQELEESDADDDIATITVTLRQMRAITSRQGGRG